ncbi:response regulator transcription factor [Crossiella sp. SN42]|uniref:response regulator transcription factor n=1 Tax=Crossiella sp. SN42 TaxID=2944808 RepID=UPI00207C9E5B|nr:response regulator transcription factor [Crossiella sp. SN42]MCO1574603.1 response regulator transcription factor [Crossiella sp. SN42]
MGDSVVEEEYEDPGTRVFVVDDGSIATSGVIQALSRCAGVDLVGTVGTPAEAVEAIRRTRPRVVITSTRGDIRPLVEEVLALAPPPVTLLTVGERDLLTLAAQSAGVSGTIPWQATAEQVTTAVLAAGGPERPELRAARPNAARLSSREIQVVLRAADGQTNSHIARALSLSEATVKTYWQRIFRKLDVHDRTMAVMTAMNLTGRLEPCDCTGTESVCLHPPR